MRRSVVNEVTVHTLPHFFEILAYEFLYISLRKKEAPVKQKKSELNFRFLLNGLI